MSCSSGDRVLCGMRTFELFVTPDEGRHYVVLIARELDGYKALREILCSKKGAQT